MKLLLEYVIGKNYGKLNKVTIAGKVWFRAKSVCEILGLRNTSVAVRGNYTRIGYFGIDETDICKLGVCRNSPPYISEAGVWKLILKSRKPAATAIKNALSEVVLVEIMKTGSYQGK